MRHPAHLRALAAHLDLTPADLEPVKWDTYGLPTYRDGTREYAVGTDRQADTAARRDIEESLWAFRASFLVDYIPGDLDPKHLERIQSDSCEGCNDLIRAMVGPRFSRLVSDAISCDGRGHFLSGYDGEEHEETVNGRTFYIYRIN